MNLFGSSCTERKYRAPGEGIPYRKRGWPSLLTGALYLPERSFSTRRKKRGNVGKYSYNIKVEKLLVAL